MGLEDTLAELRQRVDELQSLSPRFAPLALEPLADDELAAFEAEHGIVLPPSHRRWLEVFGRQPLVPGLIGGRALSLADSTGDPIYGSFRGRLADAFAYAGTAPLSMDWDDARDDYADLEPLRGTLCLGSGGCDEIWLLVVTGTARGTVWGFVPGLDQELQPTGMTAAAWSLERIKRHVQLERARRR